MRVISFGILLLLAPLAIAQTINVDIAKAYNEGVVRCSNPVCAKYLYACFQTYSSDNLQSFLTCGSQASRLNEDQLVVANPSG